MKALIFKILGHIVVFYRRLKHTCENLTVHGPSFLVRKDVHIIYRLVYFVIYLHVWLAATATIIRYYTHYQENTIRFTTRTDYLEWNTTFPSVTICETLNPDKIAALTEQLEDEHRLDNFYGDIAFYTGTCYSCQSICERDRKCPTNFTILASDFRTSCKSLFINCKWDNEPIDCCKHFRPVATEYGICYSMNNRHTRGKQFTYVASSKRRRQMGALEIVASQDYEAFIHAPDDVPFWNQEYDRRITVKYGAEATVTFSIMDIVNEPEVYFIAPETRQCRFAHEIPDNFLAYKLYSYSACIIECRIQMQIKLCNCTHHLSPIEYKKHFCDLDGLKCLTNNYTNLKKLKVPGTNDTGIECDCLPSCTEPDFNVVAKKLDEPEKGLEAGTVLFTLGNKPYQRLSRQVARTTLDLVVAMGNCFSLCFGGSLLSIVEIAYYLCFKRWKFTKEKK